jgi:hypothetical protein
VNLRAGALVLLLAAIALYAALGRPLRQQAGRTGDEYRRLRDERRTQQSRMAVLQRRESRQQALAAASGQWSREDAVRGARAAVVRSLDEASLRDVRLGVGRPDVTQLLASIRLSAEGDFGDVVRASGHMVRPGSGLVLQRVQMKPNAESVTLRVDAVVPRGER